VVCFSPPLPSIKDWEWWGRDKSPQSCFALHLPKDLKDSQEGGKTSCSFCLPSFLTPQVRVSVNLVVAVAPSSHPPLPTQIFCSMEEVNFALGPAEWEGLFPQEGNQVQRVGFVAVISCSDPARLEEANLWG